MAEPRRIHQDQPVTLVLLVNLGSPTRPTPGAVRRFLREFLSDRRVVEVPRLLWWCILNLIILPLRTRRIARHYADIFTSEGAPLVVGTARLSARLGEKLKGRAEVDFAMRYGEPSIAAKLASRRDRHLRRLVVLPLYPQYAASTTGTAFDQMARALKRQRWTPDLRYINAYYDDGAYIEALAASIKAKRKPGHLLLLSFHGLPLKMLLKGDPYYCHCHKTARLLAARLRLGEDEWRLTFQSRFGMQTWLQPYTDRTLQSLPGQGVTRVQVACPGFAVDCLETLEEIARQCRNLFLEAGGESFEYFECLNDTQEHVNALATIAGRQLDSYATDDESRLEPQVKKKQRTMLYNQAVQSLGLDNNPFV